MYTFYEFGSSIAPAVRSMDKGNADLEIDGAVGRDISISVVLDDAKMMDLVVGRTFTELSYLNSAIR